MDCLACQRHIAVGLKPALFQTWDEIPHPLTLDIAQAGECLERVVDLYEAVVERLTGLDLHLDHAVAGVARLNERAVMFFAFPQRSFCVYLLGGFNCRDEHACNLAGGLAKRAVAEREVSGLARPTPFGEHKHVLAQNGFSGAEDSVDHRSDGVPDLRPGTTQ